jgi:P27 family predicted phage terminase small subunit
MSKGRKPVPDQVKKLRGTDDKRRLRGEMIKAKPLTALEKVTQKEVYKNLQTDRSKRMFYEKAEQLMALSILTEQDLDQLMLYSHALDKLMLCIEKMETGMFKPVTDEDGNIIKFVQNPYLKLYKELIVIVNKLGSEFGFSPVSRLKVKPTEEKKSSPLQELIALSRK